MIAVALAGGAGAATRLVTDGLVRARWGDRLPWGTLLINVLGSATLGWVVGSGAPASVVAIVGTGFCGGFTTFSTASFETVRLALDKGRLPAALAYGFGTLVLCVGVAAGAARLAG